MFSISVEILDLICSINLSEIFEGMPFNFTKGLNQKFSLSHSVIMGPTEIPSQSSETIKIPTAHYRGPLNNSPPITTMIDDQDLGFFANFLGIFIFVLVIAYHYVMADPKYEGN
ncbi:Mitochondrial import receptor subunit TOM40-1 [Abeliophyllum distichum]|uniref:Mitochondrial import receptor subunit TOM40-1 n=1 Tax=Abeliophyllum distichum TaxID=126358 RepID=A0ABD1R9Y9_9LAMI